MTNAQLKDRIERYVAKWLPILGLESWGLTVTFDEAKHLATCKAIPSYEEAALAFNLRRIKAELPNFRAALEELCLHELAHCICWRESERSVSRVTRSLLRARGRLPVR